MPSEHAGVTGINVSVDTDAQTVKEEFHYSNGCTQVADLSDGVRKPMMQMVECTYAMSQDPDDFVVKITSDDIEFGVKSRPHHLDRSSGALTGPNGATIAICAPAGSGNKF